MTPGMRWNIPAPRAGNKLRTLQLHRFREDRW